ELYSSAAEWVELLRKPLPGLLPKLSGYPGLVKERQPRGELCGCMGAVLGVVIVKVAPDLGRRIGEILDQEPIHDAGAPLAPIGPFGEDQVQIDIGMLGRIARDVTAARDGRDTDVSPV